MSQYGLPFDYDEPWVSGALDLSIETLTGTAFEIRVAPTDTIMSIKTKIQRVEGIPVSQQHLLYNLVELDNSASVQDYAIQNGATLKLILSMRGGPISTRRLPPADEALWREVQEWMADGRRDERSDRLTSASRTSILVFRDGESVNLFRVVENDDGTYSPLAQSWSASSLKNLLTKDDPVESDKRLMENWVTMGKMQELKGKLEKLSITKKDKTLPDDGDEDDCWYDADVPTGALDCSEDVTKACSSKASSSSQDSRTRSDALYKMGTFKPTPSTSAASHEPTEFYLRPRGSLNNPDALPPMSIEARPPEMTPLLPVRRIPAVNEGASFSDVGTRPLSLDADGSRAAMARPLNQTFFQSMRKARKEAENIIRLQSKSLSVVVDSHSCGNLKRAPLPDIRRSPRPERQPTDEDIGGDKSEMRGKTGSRMSTSSFAIVEEESDMAAGPSICSSQSSLVALPSNDDVVVTFSPISRDHGSASMGRSRFRVSRFVLENAERPKTTPSKEQRKELDNLVADAEGRNRKHAMCSTVDLAPSWYSSKAHIEVRDLAETQRATSYNESYSKSQHTGELRGAGQRTPAPRVRPTSPPPPPPAAVVKKRPRCLVCKKRLNITNTHTCRCSGIFCSTHRYSETHECHFDYKEEGKHLLRLANPLVTAPKLPKI